MIIYSLLSNLLQTVILIYRKYNTSSRKNGKCNKKSQYERKMVFKLRDICIVSSYFKWELEAQIVWSPWMMQLALSRVLTEICKFFVVLGFHKIVNLHNYNCNSIYDDTDICF